MFTIKLERSFGEVLQKTSLVLLRRFFINIMALGEKIFAMFVADTALRDAERTKNEGQSLE